MAGWREWYSTPARSLPGAFPEDRATESVEEFLARGGKVTRCPTAGTEELRAVNRARRERETLLPGPQGPSMGA